MRWRSGLVAATLVVGGLSGAAATPGVAMAGGGDATRTQLITGWSIQSSTFVRDGGAAVSRPTYGTRGWLSLSRPGTLMAGLLENGRYPDIFKGENLAAVPTAQFDVNWWYRNRFVAHPRPGRHTFLIINGVNGTADVWVNGTKVADRARVQGSYGQDEIDITGLVRDGANAVALDVTKNDNDFSPDPSEAESKHLTLNMVDWNPPSPDRYTGLQFAPEIAQDGPVSVRDAHVTQRNAPDMGTSDLTLKATVRNNTTMTQSADVAGTVTRGRTTISCRARVTVPAHATRPVAIGPADCPRLHVVRPDVWWPYQMGDQPLYHYAIQAAVRGRVSDGAEDDFGIRTVTSTLTPVVPGKTIGPDGYRQYAINGVPFVVRGGGWSQDMFLRYSPSNIADQVSYIKNMGLNAIRFEGNFPPDDMFDQLDRAGILAMTGLQCCDRWEDFSTTWGPELKANAANQIASIARRLRSHPSVFTFLHSSDYALDQGKADIYLPAFRAADWETPQIGSAWYRTSPELGPSGTKEGSYNYGPPAYWWANGPESANDLFPTVPFLFSGSSWGLETEAGAGNTIPTQDSLDRFASADEQRKIWDPATTNGPSSGEDLFHTSAYTPYYQVSRMGVYNTALWKRYGRWSDMASYQKLVQLGEYEVTRAVFDAFIGHSKDPANPSTGIIYWMMNKAWPSLQWNLYGYDFDQSGVFFGAKKANEPVHALYAYDDGSIKVANLSGRTEAGLKATVDLIDLDGTIRSSTNVDVPALAPQDVRTVLAPELPEGISTTYFARLSVKRGDALVSRNVYWLSTKADEIDWDATHASFQGYPTFKDAGYADLTGLQTLPAAKVAVRATTRRVGRELATTVTLTNTGTGKTPVVGARADLFADGKQILPIRWSDNQVTLWPGESQQLTALYDADDVRGRPTVRLTGLNVATSTTSAG